MQRMNRHYKFDFSSFAKIADFVVAKVIAVVVVVAITTEFTVAIEMPYNCFHMKHFCCGRKRFVVKHLNFLAALEFN